MAETRRLGRDGPALTTVGFGAWAAGGPWFFGWGPQDDEASVAAIRRTLELGVNWIDTAAVYGLGHSEEVVGRAIRGLPRDSFILATKCGRIASEGKPPRGDLRPVSMRKEMEDSLRRLGTDHVDLYQIHWPDKDTGTPLEESWATMAALKDEGKTRWIGVSNFDVPLLQRCEAIRHVDSLQPPYSLLARDVEAEILPYCRQHGIGVIAYSPMQSGLLSGSFDPARLAPDDWRRRNPHFQEPRLSRNLAFVEALRPIAARRGKTVGQLVVAWTLRNPAVTAAIVGARSAAQAEANAGAMGFQLTDGEAAAIEAAYRSTVLAPPPRG
jgi:aryl-alcohol dehydrogenase-like predicted oxidoreductase